MCANITVHGRVLESGHEKADWMLKKLIRASIPTPMENLVAFKGLTAHFRKSELAEVAKQNSFRISERLRPHIDDNGVTLKAIKMDPLTLQIRRRFKMQVSAFVTLFAHVVGGVLRAVA